MSATNSDQVTKKQKTQANVVNIPSSITVHFTNQENSRVGPPVDIPVDSNTKQLEMLINSLLSNDEKVLLNQTIYENSDQNLIYIFFV
jgi:hypothetical protein